MHEHQQSNYYKRNFNFRSQLSFTIPIKKRSVLKKVLKKVKIPERFVKKKNGILYGSGQEYAKHEARKKSVSLRDSPARNLRKAGKTRHSNFLRVD